MRSTVLLALASSFSLHAVVEAWGDIGHRTIALLAERYFTQASADLVSSLLGDLEDATVSDAATWADSVRRTPGFTQTGAWHYIDAMDSPPKSCSVNYKRDCQPKEGCVVSAIVNQVLHIEDPRMTTYSLTAPRRASSSTPPRTPETAPMP